MRPAVCVLGGTLVFSLLLILLYHFLLSTVTTSFRYKVSSGLNFTSSKNFSINLASLGCLEPNICPLTVRDGLLIYKYTRLFSFIHYLNQPINYDVNVTHDADVVPRTVHLVWIKPDNNTFQFFQFMCMMAVQRFARPSRIFLWHDTLPEGYYWQKVLASFKNLYFVYRERPTQIFGNPIFLGIHVSDVVRMEAVMEYGGVYFDFDSILVNPVDRLLKHDTTMGHEVWYLLANGMLFAKPWSDFFRLWYSRYSTFDNSFQMHSNMIPHVIAVHNPNLIHVEETSICKPNYNMRAHLFDEGKLWNFLQDNYSIHLYTRALYDAGFEDLNPENIKYMNNTVGTVARHVYYGDSKLWGYKPLPFRNRTTIT